MIPIDAAAYGKVAVIFGGLSAEREISMLSGRGVLGALQSRGIDAHAFDPMTQELAELKTAGFQRAFIALHGRFGEDGAIQGALELLGIPYTGSGVMGSAVAMDKIFTKRVWQARGLPTPRYLVLDDSTSLREVPDVLGLPLIVKPPHEGSTLGITKVVGYSNMKGAFAVARELDDVVLAEEFIDGRELTVSIVSSEGRIRALPIIEIVAPEGNYDYQNKYFTDDTRYLCPAPLDGGLTQRISAMAIRAFEALGCEGWGRVDVMLRREDSEPFLLEANTSPGMTGHSLVPMAARAVGMSYEDLCLEILTGASLKIKRAAPNMKPDSEV